MLPSIFTTCVPRAEIQSGQIEEEIFAAKLRVVVERKAPNIYQDAGTFFANTFATEGIKSLIQEVFGRLSKTTPGAPVIRLETSFGGGKTHDLIALWHICRESRQIEGLERFTDLKFIPDHTVAVAAVDGRDLDPENGIYHGETGITTYTLWGEIAYQIGGVEGYKLLQGSDTQGISPGTSVLERLINNQPTVIILDEVARYLRAAKAKKVHNTDLAQQVVAFLFTLMDLAASCNHLVFVYSLASAGDTFSEETTELGEVFKASARQERVLRPSTDIEIYNIVKKRLFASIDDTVAYRVADDYLNAYRLSRMNLPDGCKDAVYREAIAQSYPFHPELFNLLNNKIGFIPEFQRTRGALRLFAYVVQHLWQKPTEWIPLIHTHHIPVGIHPDITNDLTSRLQRPLMLNPIRADIYNPDSRPAYAQVQDDNWIAAGKPPYPTWITRTIFLHSINQGTAAGIRQTELNLSLLTPGMEMGFVDQVLQQLSQVAWYLDVDPITTLARFKEEPSINKIVTEEKEQIGRTEAKEDLRTRRDSIFAKKLLTPIFGPQNPADVQDVADEILLCIIDFDEATVSSSTDAAPALVEQIFQNTGQSGTFRLFRNHLVFLVANAQELEHTVEVAREYKAIHNILKSPSRLEELSESQQKQLRERSGKIDLDVRIALTKTYRHLFYPAEDRVKAPKGLQHYVLSSQDASSIKGKSNQQEMIIKALRDCEKIRSSEAKSFAPAYILQKVWPAGLESITIKGLREQFAKNPALNILLDAEIALLRDTIRQGIEQGLWDLKVGERVWIKTDSNPLVISEPIEFSERMELYRRGILQPPKPKEIELNTSVGNSSEITKPVEVRWRAKGAIRIQLYQDGTLIPGEFQASDHYQGLINQSTTFRVVADYGNGETSVRETRALIAAGRVNDTTSSQYVVGGEVGTLWEAKPPELKLTGTLNTVFTQFQDQCQDFKVKQITEIELTVAGLMDYRKLLTALALLNRWQPQIDQMITCQHQGQFIHLEYQGPVRGFQGFATSLTSLLNTPDLEGDFRLTLTLALTPPLAPEDSELSKIREHLSRNPVEYLVLNAKVSY